MSSLKTKIGAHGRTEFVQRYRFVVKNQFFEGCETIDTCNCACTFYTVSAVVAVAHLIDQMAFGEAIGFEHRMKDSCVVFAPDVVLDVIGKSQNLYGLTPVYGELIPQLCVGRQRLVMGRKDLLARALVDTVVQC